MLLVTDNTFCSQNVLLEVGTTHPLPWLIWVPFLVGLHMYRHLVNISQQSSFHIWH